MQEEQQQGMMDWHCMACGHEFLDEECLDYPGSAICPGVACDHSDESLMICEEG